MSLVLALAPWGTQDHFMHPSLLMLNQIDVHILLNTWVGSITTLKIISSHQT